MSARKLAVVAVAAGAAGQLIYQINPDCAGAKVSLNILNPNATVATIKVAIMSGVAPTDLDYIENGTKLDASGGVLERTSLELSPAEKIYIISSGADLVVRLTGEEYES